MAKTSKGTKRPTPEAKAIAMFKRGAKARAITRETGIPYWMVKGLAIADVISKTTR